MFVEESIKDEFLQRVVERTRNIRVGNPMDPKTQMGPMISGNHLNRVLEYVDIGKKEVRIQPQRTVQLNIVNIRATIS